MKHYTSFLDENDEINREDMYSSSDELEAMHSELDDADYDTEVIRLDLIADWVRMNFCFDTEESYYLACDLVEAELIDPDDVQLFSAELLVRNVQNTRKEILSLPGAYLRSRLRKTED